MTALANLGQHVRCWFGLRRLLTGCQLSRPYTRDGGTWAVCQRCGRHRRIDTLPSD